MNWFLIALTAPALWGLVNHLDKYIISRYFSGKGVGSLVLFTSMSGFVVAVFIVILGHDVLSFGVMSAIIIAINGVILVASFIPYLHALEKEEASTITALFQFIPVFSYFLALFFLHEGLSAQQIFASLLVITGAIIISLDLSVAIRFKVKPFLLMVLSAFMISISGLVFKMIAIKEDFWGTVFWEYMGGALFGLALFLCIGLYRRQFLATIAKGRVMVFGLNSLAEFLNIFAKLIVNFASLLAPLALIWVVNGFQPLFVFVYGIILTLFFPHIGREALGKKSIAQKAIAIIIIFIGAYFLLG
ncbi:MAG: EamA family transporter [Candidatus Azambacteria bacterium]|nr:EamA family transporter [Candidatus Azambacteria bacterium]